MATQYGTIFNALNRNSGCAMALEGSVEEYLSNKQNRKPAASHILMSSLFHKKKMIQENIV